MSKKLSSSLEHQHKMWQQNQENRRKLIKRTAAITMATALMAARLMAPLPAAHAETNQGSLRDSDNSILLAVDLSSDEMSDEASDGMSDENSDEYSDEMSDENSDEDSDENSDYTGYDFSDEFSDENSDERPFELRAKGLNRTLLRVGKPIYFVNDVRSRLDAPPMVDNGRTLLPLRFVAQAMGGTVNWDPSEQKVTITKGNDVIELWIGSNIARVNGIQKLIDPANDSVKATVVPGANRTMVPVRFVAEEMGADVFWDQGTRTISIKY